MIPLYSGAALAHQTVAPRAIRCGCGVHYSPSAFAKLKRAGRQDAGDGTFLMLSTCACGSTIAMPWCGFDDCTCSDILSHGIADNVEGR